MCQRCAANRRHRDDHVGTGFTLLELLVVVAVIALLLAILLPAQRYARVKARVVKAHSDLRQICLALDAYAMDNDDDLPPTRSACGADITYQLPVELAEQAYLPRSESRIPQAELQDVFDPGAPDGPVHTYRYRAPGAIWFNGVFFDFPDSTWRLRAKIWVPDDFPRCESPEGRFYANRSFEPPSPAVYAVWSVGPDPESAKLPRVEGTDEIDTAKFPLPRRFWLHDSGDTGLITHFRSREGHTHASP
jgi:prepilin-type N-terminal cleavage/methylation domain-containing protein